MVKLRRSDAWEAQLTDEQRWRVYDKLKSAPWYEVAQWLVAEYGIVAPARSALYAFKKYMAEQESEHRIEEALSDAQALRREMAEVGDLSEELAYAWMQEARVSRLKGDSQAAQRYWQMALALSREQREKAEQQIREEAGKRADAALELERERFAELKRRNDEARAKLAQAVTANKGGMTAETLKTIEEALKLL